MRFEARVILLAGLLAGAVGIPGRAAACTTAVGYRVMHIGARVVAVWYPTAARAELHPYGPTFSGAIAPDAVPSTACGAPVPLVVFSHGDLGCGLQSVAFTEELARHGYVVAAPDHADAALCHTLPPVAGAWGGLPAQPPILKPQDWDDRSRVDRRADVESVIDTLLSDPAFGSIIDGRHIGLAGHSLGGYTAVGIAGGWATWTDHRIRAVLAMSPYVMPFQVRKTLTGVRVPIMYQGGTRDVGITPFLLGAQGAYAAANAPAYFMVLRGASHFAWVNCGQAHTTRACLDQVADMRLITTYGIAFFDRYLRGAAAPILDRRDPALARYEFK